MEHTSPSIPTDPAALPPRMRGIQRRTFLSGMAGIGTALAGAAVFSGALPTGGRNKAFAATTTLPIPDLLTPTVTDGSSVHTLNMKTGTHEVLSGVSSSTAGFNGTFLGPTMKWTNGDTVQVNVTNNLGEDTTVHWHGAHVPAKVDGGPQVAF